MYLNWHEPSQYFDKFKNFNLKPFYNLSCDVTLVLCALWSISYIKFVFKFVWVVKNYAWNKKKFWIRLMCRKLQQQSTSTLLICMIITNPRFSVVNFSHKEVILFSLLFTLYNSSKVGYLPFLTSLRSN